jgi:hypothetical protein
MEILEMKWFGPWEKDLSWEKEKADPPNQEEEKKVEEQKPESPKKKKASLLWAGREAGWPSDVRRPGGRGNWINSWMDRF